MTAFTTIRAVGSALPADVLAATISDANLKGLTADDYHLELGVTPREAANRAWSVLTSAWLGYREALSKLAEGDRAVGLTREKWLAVLLRELGFGRVPTRPAGGLTADDKSFPISHAHDLAIGRVPLHLLGWGVPLDSRTPGQPGAADRAPHAMVQEYLNRTDDALWAMVSNGRTLRLLRDSSTLIGQSYVEFDLESMFDGEIFSDFVALFLVCHASRFEPDQRDDATIADCWLERWRTYAAETGTRALQALSPGVKQAIEVLGTGFLRHPANDIHHQLVNRTLSERDVREALLRLVYRLLFCFVAEDRGLLLDPDGAPLAKQRYEQWFSMARLRRIATRRRGSAHPDLWQAVSLVLDGLGQEGGRPQLALPGLGGLFDAGEIDVFVGCQLANEPLLAAIRHLTVVQPVGGGPKRVIDYRNLGAEELGSIYESLLEFVPRYDRTTRTFTLESVVGNDRKTSGAYYTPSSLIDCLLDSALDPLLDEAERVPDPEAAMLALTVCDPACGSGHFLVAAAKRIAARLASVRARSNGNNTGEPTVIDGQRAMHDVVDRCIYGVDLNPMAVELAKVSLWLESVQPGRALSFLNAHIKVGNALLGTTPTLIAAGLPDAAFTALDGDDKKLVPSIRRRNKQEREGQGNLFGQAGISVANTHIGRAVRQVEALPNSTLADVHLAQQRFREFDSSSELKRARAVADAWCAAFVAVKAPGQPEITHATIARIADGGAPDAQIAEVLTRLSATYRFFHWHLEFPQIFTASDQAGEEGTGWTGGFSCVLGNPPWDTLSPDTREFFSDLVDDIRSLPPEQKDQRIEELLHQESYRRRWTEHQRYLFATAHFLKRSGRYRMFAEGNLGKGDFNLYRMFVETALTVTQPDGIAAQVTPAGLYGGANASALRRHLLDHCRLRLLLGCENTGKSFFPDVHPQTWFAVYAARVGGRTTDISVCFGIGNPKDLPPPASRIVTVSADVIRTQAPDTYAIPDLRNTFEMTVAAKLVSSFPAFGQQDAGPPFRHYQREVDMGNDNHLFSEEPGGLPLYEGRMIDAFDHRAKIYVSGHGNSSKWLEPSFGDPAKQIVPQWRVSRSDIPAKLGNRCDRYRIGFGDVANPRNERSFVATLIAPGTICGDKVPTIDFPSDYQWAYMPWLAVANSFTMDWLVRSKLASAKLSSTLMDSLPFPRYSVGHPVVELIAPIALRLICTSVEMTRYWNEMSSYGWCEPIDLSSVPAEAIVDPDLRTRERARIDAIVAKRVYGLNEDELSYLLDQFPVVEKRDRQRYGEYRTKRLVLEHFRAV